MDDMSCDGVVVEGRESMNERRDEEVRVEGEERAEEGGVGGDGLRELREGVGHVNGGSLGVGEAEQADGAAFRLAWLGGRAWICGPLSTL
ncbi:hypothetical protein Pyn_07085 [Prunus yedoensis var. nudiflora]|uniref:Uncharacterized protein n=1 Tax=Prunus yedoensis var. nudiflora TaxID=2094558 RepID=A0A314ZLJ5_PRUYE|nr:hypothetical protein Pyn_07085 [Prunus yedoensis var. nudiflora]